MNVFCILFKSFRNKYSIFLKERETGRDLSKCHKNVRNNWGNLQHYKISLSMFFWKKMVLSLSYNSGDNFWLKNIHMGIFFSRKLISKLFVGVFLMKLPSCYFFFFFK